MAAVAIEPLARRGGASKGSVYWHFKSRQELLDATLERWEVEHTDAMIALAARGSGAAERLKLLLSAVLHPEANANVELALLASSDEPAVAAAVARVTERRIGHLAGEFGELGLPPDESRRRALIAYSVYLGQAQLLRSAPQILPATAAERRRHRDDLLRALLVGTTAGPVRLGDPEARAGGLRDAGGVDHRHPDREDGRSA